MKKWVIIGIIGIVVVVIVIGIFIMSPEKECKTADDCLTKTCFTTQCKSNNCTYSPITDCCGNEICEQGETYSECAADCSDCDDNNDCTLDEYDYHEQKCVNKPILDVVCCGNSICELEETHENCVVDCPNCNDENECTEDSYDYHGQDCINEPIIPCCGNGICDEDVETNLDCSTDCPNCDDNDRLTEDIFNYTIQKCEHITYYLIDDFDEGSASWSLDPRWSIIFPEEGTNGMLTYDTSADYAYTDFGNSSWTDYAFSFKVKFEKGATALAYVRQKYPEGTYVITISENQLILWKEMGEEGINLKDKMYPFALNEFYDIKMEAKGSSIKIYVDDTLEITYIDNNPILSGGVALEALNKKVYFDDVKVKGPQ